MEKCPCNGRHSSRQILVLLNVVLWVNTICRKEIFCYNLDIFNAFFFSFILYQNTSQLEFSVLSAYFHAMV